VRLPADGRCFVAIMQCCANRLEMHGMKTVKLYTALFHEHVIPAVLVLLTVLPKSIANIE